MKSISKRFTRAHVLFESLESRQFLSAVPALSSLSIVQAKTGKVLTASLGPSPTLDLGALGAISLQANPQSSLGSVVFKLDGKIIQTESYAPYDITGDNNGSPNAWTPAPGSHTLVVTPYSQLYAKGTAGTPVTVQLNVVKTTTPAFPTHVSWTNGANSPVVRAEAVGAAVGGKLYVFGGFDAQGSVATTIHLQSRCDVYDPSTNRWTRLADFPEPFTHSQGVVVGTDIWFPGGYIGNHPGPGTTHVWVYHTTNDTWTRGPDLPQARGAGAAALVGHTIYFTGGMNQTRTIDEATTYALDLNNLAAGWVRKADLPNGRNHVAAASLGGYLYVLGGQHGQEENQAAQAEVDRYDPATNTWTTMAPLPPTAGKSHITSGTFVYNGRIIIVGGEVGYNNAKRVVMSYDPASNSWIELGLLPAARSTTVSGIIDGKLIVATGNDPSPTTTLWIGTLS